MNFTWTIGRVRGKVLATAYMDETGLLIPQGNHDLGGLGDVNYSRVVDNKKYQNHLDQGMTNAFFR
jgi:hypothetical protein